MTKSNFSPLFPTLEAFQKHLRIQMIQCQTARLSQHFPCLHDTTSDASSARTLAAPACAAFKAKAVWVKQSRTFAPLQSFRIANRLYFWSKKSLSFAHSLCQPDILRHFLKFPPLFQILPQETPLQAASLPVSVLWHHCAHTHPE